VQPDNIDREELTEAERRARLAAAARALRTWVKARPAESAGAPAIAPQRPGPVSASSTAPSAVPPIQMEESRPSAAAASASVVSLFGTTFDEAAPSSSAENVPASRVPRLKLPALPLPNLQTLPTLPHIRWSRTASIASGALLIALAIAGGIYGNREAIGSAWTSMQAEESERVAVPAMGSVALTSTPDPAVVSIGAREIGPTPVNIELPPGAHTVTFRRGEDTYDVVVEVVAGGAVEGRVDWTSLAGRLRVATDPPGATVAIAGQERGPTPVLIEDLPVGTHVMVLRSASGTVERRVTISAGHTTEVTESIYSGFVHVSAPFEISITRQGRLLQLDEQNQLMLPPGVHSLTFENTDLNFREVRRVEVSPGGRTQLAILPEATTLTVTATQPAEVFLDGERIGETSIVRHTLPIGTHQLLVRSLATGVVRQVTVTATTNPVTLDVDFSAP